MKIVSIRSFSGAYFPALGLDIETYQESLYIQWKFTKIWTRKALNADTLFIKW